MKTNIQSIRDLARVISRNWKNPYYGAVPYLNAMHDLEGVDSSVGSDDARGIIRYFLVNASTWRGPVAKATKAMLKALVDNKKTLPAELEVVDGLHNRDPPQHRGHGRGVPYAQAHHGRGEAEQGFHYSTRLPQEPRVHRALPHRPRRSSAHLGALGQVQHRLDHRVPRHTPRQQEGVLWTAPRTLRRAGRSTQDEVDLAGERGLDRVPRSRQPRT